MNRFLWIAMFLVSCSGCDQRVQERVYDEVVIEAPRDDMTMTADPHAGMGLNVPMGMSGPVSDPGLQWDVPQGWSEIPGGGMRVVSFKSSRDPEAVDVSIVSLSGEAGGLEPNLIRWGKQIGIDLQADESGLKGLIDKAQRLTAHDGSQVQVFDFRTLQKDKTDAKSMVASMLRIGGSTVFVKMTGNASSLKDNFEPFKQLTESVRNK